MNTPQNRNRKRRIDDEPGYQRPTSRARTRPVEPTTPILGRRRRYESSPAEEDDRPPPPPPSPTSPPSIPNTEGAYRRRLSRLLVDHTPYTSDDLLDDNGQRRPIQQLLAMAKASPIWLMLTDEEKSQITQSTGVLANDRGYIPSDAPRGVALPRRAQFVLTATGQRYIVE